MPLDQIDVDELEHGDEKEMSFFDHLEELRWHLIRSIGAIFVGAILVFLSGSWVFDNVLFWPKNESFPTYRFLCWLSDAVGLGDAACFTPPSFKLTRLHLEEEFMTHLKVAGVLGFVMSFPYIFWEMWRFISPGLKSSERKYTRGIVFICSMLFFLGVAFGYFVICPFAVSFFASYNISDQVTPGIQISSFVNSITMFAVPAGVVFELPVVIYFLSKVGLVTPEGMKQYRRHAFLAILLLSAFITPPDVISQFFIGVPLYGLYEISISISARVLRNAQKRELELYET